MYPESNRCIYTCDCILPTSLPLYRLASLPIYPHTSLSTDSPTYPLTYSVVSLTLQCNVSSRLSRDFKHLQIRKPFRKNGETDDQSSLQRIKDIQQCPFRLMFVHGYNMFGPSFARTLTKYLRHPFADATVSTQSACISMRTSCASSPSPSLASPSGQCARG